MVAIPPYPPNLLKAVPGAGQVTLNWVVPNSDGGSAITSYVVTPMLNGTTPQPQLSFPANSTYKYTEVITGLTSGS